MHNISFDRSRLGTIKKSGDKNLLSLILALICDGWAPEIQVIWRMQRRAPTLKKLRFLSPYIAMLKIFSD